MATSKKYTPNEKEKYMCAKQKAFFKKKLSDWKNEIIEANTKSLYLNDIDQEISSPDIVDQASSQTEKTVEMRTLNRQRKLLSKIDIAIKKIKVGHAGTLDPLATGVVVLCTGKKTKTINDFLIEDKVYTGKIQLGATTPSFDLETAIDNKFLVPEINEERIHFLEEKFSGKMKQVPPIFSAKPDAVNSLV